MGRPKRPSQQRICQRIVDGLQEQKAKRMRTDPTLANITCIVQGHAGQEIRAPAHELGVVSEVIYNGFCGEGVKDAQIWRLPRSVTLFGFNNVHDFVRSPKYKLGTLLEKCKGSGPASDYTSRICAAVVEIMEAADYFVIDSMVSIISAEVKQGYFFDDLNPAEAWRELQAAVCHEKYSLLFEDLVKLMARDPNEWLLRCKPGRQPFAVSLSSTQLAELIGSLRKYPAERSHFCRSKGLREIEFEAVMLWIKHREEGLNGGGVPAGELSTLTALFDAKWLSYGMSVRFLKETVVPSGLLPADTINEAVWEMVSVAEKELFDFKARVRECPEDTASKP